MMGSLTSYDKQASRQLGIDGIFLADYKHNREKARKCLKVT
jgi:hypothetical protein